jgi:hypothetical protein
LSGPLARPLHGPLVGQVTPALARIWLRGDAGMQGAIRYRFDAGTWQTVAVPLRGVDFDYTGVAGLAAPPGWQRLEYSAGICSGVVAVPGADAPEWKLLDETCGGSVRRPALAHETFSFIFGSCRHRGYGPYRLGDRAFGEIDKLIKETSAPDFLLLGGDQVYCDHDISDEFAQLPLFHGDTPGSLQAYYRKYRHDFALPNWQAATRKLPSFMTFDDHEVENEWGGYQYLPDRKGRTRRPRATLQQGLQAYFAYQACHSPAFPAGVEPHIQEPERNRYWYRFSWGAADFFVLDTRVPRRHPLAADATMLGGEQYRELMDFLRVDDARWKFVLSSVPLAPDIESRNIMTIDTWRAYPLERLRLLDELRGLKRRPVFLSGDIHLACVATLHHSDDPKFVLPSIVVSAFNWFTFGVQDVDCWFPLTPRLESEKLLPVTVREVRGLDPRSGRYRREFGTPRITDDNFSRITVSPERLVVDIFYGRDGTPAAHWEIPFSDLLA